MSGLESQNPFGSFDSRRTRWVEPKARWPREAWLWAAAVAVTFFCLVTAVVVNDDEFRRLVPALLLTPLGWVAHAIWLAAKDDR